MTKKIIDNKKKSIKKKSLKKKNLKKNLKKKIIKEKKQEKINIIFDMDETLLKAIPVSLIKYLNIDKNTEYKVIKSKKYDFKIICIRNYFLFLMKFCLEKFNVGIWSNGSLVHVENCIKEILPKELFNKLNIFIFRKSMNESKITYQDLKNNKKFDLFKYNKRAIKNLNYLFEDKFYSKIFKPSNTLLLDDLETHSAVCPKNTVYLPKYCPAKNDDYLFQLYKWLDSIKNTKNIQKIEMLKFVDYKKNVRDDCSFNHIFKLINTKKIKVGDYVQFKIKDTEINGYIKNVNKKLFDIIEYTDDLVEIKKEKKSEKEDNKNKTNYQANPMKIHKNIKEVKKYVFN